MTSHNYTRNLINMPPELLLTIISHLPSSSSLYALSLTSRTLSTFIHTHASSICNTRILQNPVYLRASSILKSTYIDGWLAPQHRSIFQAEEQWQRETTSRSSSRASSPYHYRVLNMNTCCFRSASVGSNSSEMRAPRPKLVSSQEDNQRRRDSGYNSCSSSPAHNHSTNPAPTDSNTAITSATRLHLSNPGPHYLTFLTRYAPEIVARWEMDIGRTTRPITPIVVRNGNYGTQLGPIIEADNEEEIEKMEARFAEMLRLYSLRSWMLLCDETFGEGSDVEGVDFVDIVMASEKATVSRRSVFLENTKTKVKTIFSKGKTHARKFVAAVKPRKTMQQAAPAKRLLFGEIDTDSASSLASVGLTLQASKKSPSTSIVEKNDWVNSLLWYYGVSSQFQPGAPVGNQSLDKATTDEETSREMRVRDTTESKSNEHLSNTYQDFSPIERSHKHQPYHIIYPPSKTEEGKMSQTATNQAPHSRRSNWIYALRFRKSYKQV